MNDIKIEVLMPDQESFEKICDYCEENINRENHSENGGMLNYKNLTYESDILIIAFKDDVPVAYNSMVVTNNGAVLYVYQIAVKKEYQGNGIGTEIMKKAISIAKKLNMDVSAHARDYNIASRKMFNTLGFEKIEKYSTKENYFLYLKQRKKVLKEIISKKYR